jgi:serine/threonine-protein kinase
MSSGLDPAASSADFPADAVTACLERVLASPHFLRSHRLARFLRFTVEAALEGRAEELKERTIAVEVYGRRLDYDPRCDPIVRSEAHRLRAKLEAYYAHEGCGDLIAIEVPKGSYLPAFRRNGQSADAAQASLCRLVVAPFEDRSRQQRELALARGMGDALATRLAGRPGLRVLHRASAGRRDGDLGVAADYVLEGSFQRTRARCVLAVALVRVADRKELWNDTFPFEWARVAGTQDDIAERVAAAVGSFLTRAGGPRPSVSPRAYELFLKGHHGVIQYANTRQQEYLEPARRRLSSAIALESGFSDALADLAFLELLRLNPPQAPPAELIERARALLERALASNPRHARSLYLLGDVYGTSGRARQGLDLTETAVALDPDDAEARTFLALRYASLGFYEAAVACCDEALPLDPVWDAARHAKALYASHAGAAGVAIAVLEELHREAVPNSVSETILAGVRVASGDLAGAERGLVGIRARLSPQEDASHVEILEGLVAALRGDVAQARRLSEKHQSSPPRILDHLIRLALALRSSDVALRQIAESPYHRNYRWLVQEPFARPFLREPGFAQLLEELHGEWLRNAEELAARLPAAPPALPSPAEILSR